MTQQEGGKRNYWTGNIMSYKVPDHHILFTHDKNSNTHRVILVGLEPPNPDFGGERSLKEYNFIESEFTKGILRLEARYIDAEIFLRILSFGRGVSLAIVDDHTTIKLHDDVLCESEEIKMAFVLEQKKEGQNHRLWTSPGAYIVITNGRILLTAAEDDPNPDFVGRRVVDYYEESILNNPFFEEKEFAIVELLGLGRGCQLKGKNPSNIQLADEALLEGEQVLTVLEIV